MIISEKITMLRKKNDWSQEQLAEQLSVSRQSVSNAGCVQQVRIKMGIRRSNPGDGFTCKDE